MKFEEVWFIDDVVLVIDNSKSEEMKFYGGDKKVGSKRIMLD